MGDAPHTKYFLLTTGLSRGQDDATAKKKVCTWHREYFRVDGEFGTLTSVNEIEDGLMWFSVGALLPVPARALPSTAEAYDAAYKRYQVKAKARREREAKEKAFKKQCASGDIYGLRTSEMEEVPAVEALPDVSVNVSVNVTVTAEPIAAPHLLDDFTVLDLEFQQEDLLEVAGIRYQGWEPVAEFVSFVQFRKPVWRPITDLTGITALHVYDAPEEKSVLQQFKKLAGDSLLVCHNISADRRVLEAARTRQGATAELANPWLCTLALARRRVKAGLLPKDQKCGLGELCHGFKIKTMGAHRAKRDVQMCFHLLKHLHAQNPVIAADLHGAPQPGKSKKNALPTGPGLFASAA